MSEPNREAVEAVLIGTDAEINIVEAMIEAYHRARGESDESRFCAVWRAAVSTAALPHLFAAKDAEIAALRERTIAECLEALSLAAWKHEGEDTYSRALDKGARDQSKADYDAVSALLARAALEMSGGVK